MEKMYDITIDFVNGKEVVINNIKLDKEASLLSDSIILTKNEVVYFIRNSTNVNCITFKEIVA